MQRAKLTYTISKERKWCRDQVLTELEFVDEHAVLAGSTFTGEGGRTFAEKNPPPWNWTRAGRSPDVTTQQVAAAHLGLTPQPGSISHLRTRNFQIRTGLGSFCRKLGSALTSHQKGIHLLKSKHGYL